MVVDPRWHYGDPYRIEALATELDRISNEIVDRASGIVKRADAMGFEGPKAERFRDRVVEGRARAGSLGGDMSHLADSLRLVAAMVRANIEAYERAVNADPYDDLR